MLSKGIQSLRTPGFSRQASGLSTDLYVCVCAHAWGIFFIHAGLRKRWSGWESAGDTSMGAVFGHWNIPHTHTSFQSPLDVGTHLNTHKHTNGHVHTLGFASRPPSKHTLTHMESNHKPFIRLQHLQSSLDP